MGTSQSSRGPVSGVPLVPPWVEDIPSEEPAPQGELPPDDKAPRTELPLAPSRRFQATRLNVGRFAKSGDADSMRRALGYYVQQGYGGNRTMTRRMGGTARTAARLGQVLRRDPQVDLGAARDAALASGKNAEVVLDAIVEAVRPVDGTQDAEAARHAIRDALSDVLAEYPDADLLDLDDAQRQFVVQRYVALDVFDRFRLDVEKSLHAHAPDPLTAVRRLSEVRDYVMETVAAAFRKVESTSATPTGADLAEITTKALAETFSVFEGYVA